jgi:NAD(P)-dependent dehydrogenase (short-subunit alcohol dehydrogenase family)
MTIRPRTNVVITGSTGIAAAAAQRLAQTGHRVFVISRSQANCQELVSTLGSDADYALADLQDEPSAVAAFVAAAKVMGRIDALVAVAGGSARRFGDGWLHEMTVEGWNKSLELNLTTLFLSVREAIRQMRSQGGGGSIVMTSSVLATSPQPDNFTTHAYAAAKAAITGLTSPLAAAYAADHIQINTVAPGLVRTPMAQRAATDEAILAFAARKQPLAGDMLTAQSVGDALAWFVDAQHITGQVLAVDGGWSVTSTS